MIGKAWTIPAGLRGRYRHYLSTAPAASSDTTNATNKNVSMFSGIAPPKKPNRQEGSRFRNAGSNRKFSVLTRAHAVAGGSRRAFLLVDR
ncbi:hypothetical protein EPK99_15580 [Neorhizobium lilium]|uniref:Uncharacterized protein n=1 Tax=Neorhizobium lilium TaxID=2503024 RepID=A0A444LFU6_9HYPH|nr:hypothetical protein [Neorhizobium lilium]RWX77076.1 hypothetical protein EPK99_15580 [Neorhizobium lilium]